MSPAAWVAEQSARIGWLGQCLDDTRDPEIAAQVEAELTETRRKLDDFIEFANGIYWPSNDTT